MPRVASAAVHRQFEQLRNSVSPRRVFQIRRAAARTQRPDAVGLGGIVPATNQATRMNPATSDGHQARLTSIRWPIPRGTIHVCGDAICQDRQATCPRLRQDPWLPTTAEAAGSGPCPPPMLESRERPTHRRSGADGRALGSQRAGPSKR